ncbi:MAG: hypothetical protein KKF46_05210 [Nanoarchaeota archaeon]|nr:hypothetical protein [Nanoarchaeota archaeon]MBU1321732.1 hypothetical protein [Nanoarchaeota archaeon]MBU1597698.1 hypothetical protein [Nanoarchaeota archaeon]MBU2440740.1 hypothetical protein [Nanoarchaeota archaeon]
MYKVEPKDKVDKIFIKLDKKNPKQLKIIYKKLKEIVKYPYRYKNLRTPLNHLKRIHIDKHFVLVFSINEETKTIILEDYEHHDKIYKR